MSTIDPQVLYLILSKVAAKDFFYGFDAKQGAPGQTPGTITRRQLSEVYERITGNRVGARLNWDTQVGQLNTLLQKCGLPALGVVLLAEGAQAVAGEQNDALKRVHATKWPTFGELKGLYGKRG